jgi:hypothetical protein
VPIEYVILASSGNHINAKPTKELTTRIIKVEKLRENRLGAHNNVGANQWSIFM